MAKTESVGGQGVELCLEEWQARLGPDRKGATVPHCGHGPLLLFERFYDGSPPAKFWVRHHTTCLLAPLRPAGLCRYQTATPTFSPAPS